MITSSFSLTATERVLPKLALDFTTANLDSRVTFTRTTNATNPATYTNSSGVLTLATNNQPRFDYDPITLACKGLLIEESRTNLLLNSLINGTILSTQIVTTSATPYTLSFYGTGTITLTGSAIATVTGTGVYPSRKTYTFTPTVGALTCTVTGSVQYAQLEAGSFATSFIPTAATALTRNADVATMTGTNFSDWYNASQGTLEVQFSPNAVGAGTLGWSICCITDSSGTGIEIYKNTSGAYIFAYLGSNSANLGTMTAGTTYKVSTALNGTSSGSACVNAGSVSAITPTAFTPNQMGIGKNVAAPPVFCGYVKKINYWIQKLTNNEVQAISK